MTRLRRGREGFENEVYKACDLGRLPTGHISILNGSKRKGLERMLLDQHAKRKGCERSFLVIAGNKPLEEPRMGRKNDRMECSRYHAALIDSAEFLNGSSNVRKKLIPGGRLVVLATSKDAKDVMEKMWGDYAPISDVQLEGNDQVLVVGDRL